LIELRRSVRRSKHKSRSIVEASLQQELENESGRISDEISTRNRSHSSSSNTSSGKRNKRHSRNVNSNYGEFRKMGLMEKSDMSLESNVSSGKILVDDNNRHVYSNISQQQQGNHYDERSVAEIVASGSKIKPRSDGVNIVKRMMDEGARGERTEMFGYAAVSLPKRDGGEGVYKTIGLKGEAEEVNVIVRESNDCDNDVNIGKKLKEMDENTM